MTFDYSRVILILVCRHFVVWQTCGHSIAHSFAILKLCNSVGLVSTQFPNFSLLFPALRISILR